MPQDDKTRAKQLVDKNSDSGGLNVNALCDELSRLVMQWAYTAFEVFNVLTEREFDQAAHEQVATELINRINRANLIQLAQFRHGQILLQRIQYIMNCQAKSGQQVCQYIADADARAKEIERATVPRQMSPEEIEFFIERGENQKLWMKRGKLVVRKPYDPLICWDLPESGTGFSTYRIDDLKRASLGDSKYGYDQIGTKETVDAMIMIAQEWHKLHSDRKLQYGDMSRPGGINTPDHSGHKDGKTFDIRPLRNDTRSEALELNSKGHHPNYDRELTKEFIRLTDRLHKVKLIYFNNPEILNDSAFKTLVTRSDKTHYNHLHVEFT